jgi:tRNA(Glu) U13 pseudouridine synthase TruD
MNPVFSPESFVPEEVGCFLGDQPRASARIKQRPEDFIVEELDSEGHQSTIVPATDLQEEEQFIADGQFVAADLVKRGLSTYDAVKRITSQMGVPKGDATYGGLKDGNAITSQCVVFRTAPQDVVERNCWPEKLTGTGCFLKNVRRARKLLRKGHLNGNRFTLRVLLPGMTAAQIEAYLTPLLKRLSERGNLFPNFYNRQRLGRRQNLTKIGYTLMSEGAQAAIKLFLTETSPNEHAGLTAVRQALLKDWQQAEQHAAKMNAPLWTQWPYFDGMRLTLEHPSNKRLKLANEHDIVTATLGLQEGETFRRVMADLHGVFSLWIGSWQSYWFNQALAKHLRGEITIDNNVIPLYTKDPATEEWYRRNGMAGAIVENVDPDVAELFLGARKEVNIGSSEWDVRSRGNQNRNGRRHNKWRGKPDRQPRRSLEPLGPPRSAFISVRDMSYTIEDGCWNVRFLLQSGGYATTFLDCLFDVEQDERTNTASDKETHLNGRRSGAPDKHTRA